MRYDRVSGAVRTPRQRVGTRKIQQRNVQESDDAQEKESDTTEVDETA